MSQVFFIGDTHWGHRNILKYRPEFSSIQEHDETIFQGIMSVSGKRNTLWLLGDNFFSEEEVDRYLPTMCDSFMHVNWVPGNHDTDNASRQRAFRKAVTRVNKVHALCHYHEFWLSHAPIHDSELRGRKNIHGHTHSVSVKDPRYLCVSCEQVNYKPISLDEIRSIFNA